MLSELFEIELFICIKLDLALKDLQWLIYHKTKPNKTKLEGAWSLGLY